MESYIKKILNELEESQEELDEMSVTGNLDGGEGPPKTPFAFGKGRNMDKKKTKDISTNSTGFSIVKEKPKKVFKGNMGESIYKKVMSEINYREYKKDETMSAKQKVNNSIKEVNRKLYEIERIIHQNNKLKTEMGITSENYWKSTRAKFGKISERMVRVGHAMRKLGS
tara:strand:- start:661 stop:1167 length:507 start_codon:yes stop_codon:yes gene_type:complete